MRNFEEYTAEEVLEMIADPKGTDLTWYEYLYLGNKLAEIAEKANPKPVKEAKDEFLRKKVNKLEKRVKELEDKLSRARISLDWDDDLEYEYIMTVCGM